MQLPRFRVRRGAAGPRLLTALAFGAVIAGLSLWVRYKMQQSPGPTASGGTTSAGQRMTFDPGEQDMSFASLAELYNPNLEGSPQDWSFIETLNSDEVQALAIRLDSLARNYAKLQSELIPQAARIYPSIDRIKPILWDKLLKKNWKDPKLPTLYHELAKDRPDAFDFLVNLPFVISDEIRKKVIADRIEKAKDYLIGGKIRSGDRRFIERATPFVESRVADLEHRLAILQELIQRLDVEMRLDQQQAPAGR